MKTTLFTVGPVEMFPGSLELGGRQLPYFRTEEFSSVVLECDASLRRLAAAPEASRSVLLTCSGTGAMEAAVINLLGPGDRALVIKGGSFGERFCEICSDNGIAFDAIELEPGRDLAPGRLEAMDFSAYSALLVNAHETSTGALYDLEGLGALCRSRGILFIVDAISAFLCDTIDMGRMGIDALILSSQKVFALGPGLSMVLLGPRALAKVEGVSPRTHYLSLKRHLHDMDRGQTPFTPAVGIILQLQERLRELERIGAAECVRHTASLAAHFRNAMAGLPFGFFPERPSNALTALQPLGKISAYAVYLELKNKHGLVVTPNGGALKDRVFRVGHMGNLAEADLDRLVTALKEVQT